MTYLHPWPIHRPILVADSRTSLDHHQYTWTIKFKRFLTWNELVINPTNPRKVSVRKKFFWGGLGAMNWIVNLSTVIARNNTYKLLKGFSVIVWYKTPSQKFPWKNRSLFLFIELYSYSRATGNRTREYLICIPIFLYSCIVFEFRTPCWKPDVSSFEV